MMVACYRRVLMCDIFLEPPKFGAVKQSPFADQRKIIKIGYEYAKGILGGK